MAIPLIGPTLRFTKSLLLGDRDAFLKRASGVIHVGANSGQERELYEQHGLPVIWIEPIPEVFAILMANIRPFSRQQAFQHLIADQDGVEHTFHISNNEGQSSSILDLKLHKEIWPEVDYTKTISLRSVTLSSLLQREGIEVNRYDALVLDTQGSELLVLKGAVPVLNMFRFIKTEVADFEAYAGCCQLPELEQFTKEHGFKQISRTAMEQRASGGSYFDIVYERKVSAS